MKIGKVEKAILQAVYDLGVAGVPAYSLTIRERLEDQKVIGFWGAGNFYVALGELVEGRYLVSNKEPGGPERGRLPRYRYDLTGHGLAEVER